MKRWTMRRRLELNAPARPRSLLTTMSWMRFSSRDCRRGRSETLSLFCDAAARFASTRAIMLAYGREASARSCARRSLAAETIFMALVICWVFLTLRMRRRMSIKLGINPYFADPGPLQPSPQADPLWEQARQGDCHYFRLWRAAAVSSPASFGSLA